MKGKGALFSHGKDNWETPNDLFNLLNYEFNFTLDAAASQLNSKCGNCYCDEIGNALTMNWKQHSRGGNVWLNPPYSKWQEFIKKAYEEAQKGITVVCLIPSRTDCVAWHEYVMKADEIRFIRRRVNFVGGKSSAPFPSAVVIFRANENRGGGFHPLVSAIDMGTKKRGGKK